MSHFINIQGIEDLKNAMNDLPPNQQHTILFKLGEMSAVLLVDKTQTPSKLYYNDLTSRPVNPAVKKAILNLCDVYELSKQEIIKQTLEHGRTDHVKNAEEALAEIKSNILKKAWDVLKAPDKVSGLSMFANNAATPLTQLSNKTNRTPS